MKVLITGVSGFVGSYVLDRFLQDGEHEVAVLLRNPQSAWRVQSLLPRTTVIQGDYCHLEKWKPQAEAFQPESIVHLAWSGVENSARNDPRQTDNVGCTLALMHLAAQVGAKHWIGLGSQAEYGRCANRIDEHTPTQPTTLYGASKLAVAIAGQSLCSALGLRFAWLRLFSSYGPKDHTSWMIPSVTLDLLQGNTPAVTKGEQLWDYIHVADVANAIYQTTISETAAGIFNLGSGTANALRQVIEFIRDQVDADLPIGFGKIPYRPDQVMHLEADTSRLRLATDWKPQIALRDGIKQTVDWYREHQNHAYN